MSHTRQLRTGDCIRNAAAVRESSCCALHASGQQPASAPPFSTRCRAVRFHVRGVDHLRVGGSSVPGKLPEQVSPDAAPRRAHKAVIDRCRRTILGRAIAPATAALQHMHDAADDAAIVHPLDAPDIPRQVKFDPLPLLIAQPKQLPAHDPNPLPKTNQDRIVRAETLMSSDPSHLPKRNSVRQVAGALRAALFRRATKLEKIDLGTVALGSRDCAHVAGVGRRRCNAAQPSSGDAVTPAGSRSQAFLATYYARLSGWLAASSSCWRRREPTAAPASAQSFRASHSARPGTRSLLAPPRAVAVPS